MMHHIADSASSVSLDSPAAAGVPTKRSNFNTYDQGETWRANIRCELGSGLSSATMPRKMQARGCGTFLCLFSGLHRVSRQRLCAGTSTPTCCAKLDLQNCDSTVEVLGSVSMPCANVTLQHACGAL